MSEVYSNNLEHIKDELARLDLLIRRAIYKFQRSLKKNELSGLYITDQEIDALLSQGVEDTGSSDISEDSNLLSLIREKTEEIDQMVLKSLNEEVHLQYPRLTSIFGLSPFEKDIVLICLAPEIDLKYQKLYSYLQDDITKKHPTIALMQNLLFANFEEKIMARRLFSPESFLMRYRVISIEKDPSDADNHFPAQRIKLDDRIAGFLLDLNDLSDEISSSTSVAYPSDMTPDPTLPEDSRSKISGLLSSYLEGDKGNRIIFSFYGPDSEGKKKMAESVCLAIGLPLLISDIELLVKQKGDFERLLSLILREGLLQPAAVYLDNVDTALRKEESTITYLKTVNKMFRRMGWIVFLSSTSRWTHSGTDEDQMFFEFEFPVLTHRERESYWNYALNGDRPPDNNIDMKSVVSNFRFTRSQINDSVSSARNMALLRDQDNLIITEDDLITAARSCSNQNISSFGRKIIPKYVWDDIVLPRDNLQHLKELCGHVKFHSMVYGEWGFDRKHSLGKGLNILFSGPTGTGKTMATEIIANELKLDLYKIDLSTVVSKYIGETEKNLSKIFKEAETSNAIIFFDEADALFGKRSEVKDSHDRYANIEINYLLQKMEEHEGIVILATNLSKNMDEAFTRRMHFSINFPFPEREQRMLIWKSIYPREAPLAGDVDHYFLAKQLQISGGSIKNIAIRSAFMAAEESGNVDMKHIVLAVKREFQKMGKLCMENDFKQYFDLVK